MIQEYEYRFSSAVENLGRKYLDDSYSLRSKGEFEKILVYIKGDEVIGFVQYQKLYETIEISYIVVAPAYRNLGIGSEFLDYLSRDLDIKHFLIEVRASNEVAISFYEKNGFKKIRPIKNYYRDGEDAFSMEKVIM